MNKSKKIIREFNLSSLAIDNRTSVIILMFLIVVGGYLSYQAMPKENFPEITIPTIYIGIPYPGNTPLDIENLITRHIEKEVNTINGVKKISSTCIQDYGVTVVEFDFDVEVGDALLEVKDAVDKARSNLPSDLDQEPNVFELDFTEIPVININLSGDYDLEKLNYYAEYLQDEIEDLSEVSRVDIKGVRDKEVKIDVDQHKMDALRISFYDIEQAISNENITLSGGDILVDRYRRNVRIIGEFKSMEDIEDIIVKNNFQQIVYLKDIAQVSFGFKEADSYARINGNPVVSLDVLKRGGTNLINAIDKIKRIIKKAQEDRLPANLQIKLTNDTSRETKLQVDNLINSIISGVLLVVLVLLFFLGLRNALFVGVAIPLSMLMGFLILNVLGITLNVMVLFSLVLALGMLVDNGIVVVENIYRLLQEGKSLIQAAKEGVGEVAWPIISSTATTLAAFFPLMFWRDIMGEFMKYLPITLIIVLSSSLFVALIINPVLTSMFMKIQDVEKPKTKVRYLPVFIVGFLFSIALYLIAFKTKGWSFNLLSIECSPKLVLLLANITLSIVGLVFLNIYVLMPMARLFQKYVLPWLENTYRKIMYVALKGILPVVLFLGSFLLLVGAIFLFRISSPNIINFPSGDPNYINVFIELPTGTDIEKTNALATKVEQIVLDKTEKYGDIIEAVLVNVGRGTNDPNSKEVATGSSTPHKAKVTVSLVEYQNRGGVSSAKIMEEIRQSVSHFPGAKITVDKDPSGPPVGAPISIAIRGEDYDVLSDIQEKLQSLIARSDIEGIEELKTNLDQGKPELSVKLDRTAVRKFGLSTIQVAASLRTALFGKEISKYKLVDEDYPIVLRYNEKSRYDLDALLNQKIAFQDRNTGQFKQVPIASLATVEYGSTYGSIKRKDLAREVVLYSNVIEGYNATRIIEQLGLLFEEYNLPAGYEVGFTGEAEQQAESLEFLITALLIAVFFIFLIIVAQFNSLTAPLMIMLSVVFSTIGVFLGLVVFNMDFVVIMTMIGIISLAGVVVNNAIVLIDYTDLTRRRLHSEMNIPTGKRLPIKYIKQAIVEGGKTRLRPVLLTAITTVLGLIPLAVGININFFTLYTDLDPQFYIGGDNVKFWGPMSWTVIFGLTFATFLTLVILPIMIYIFDWLTNFVYKKLYKS